MLELLEKYRAEALAELAQAETDRKDLKAKQGEVSARLNRIGTRLQLLSELKSEVAQSGHSKELTNNHATI